MGWVSILDPEKLKDVLDIPERVQTVAYLCLGHVSHFNDEPELQKKGWRKRLDLTELTNFDGFGKEASDDDPFAERLLEAMKRQQAAL